MSDLIDRQSVLDIIFLDPGISEMQAKMIIDLPSAEPKWIPVDGQVPNNEVLCCDKYGNIMIGSVYESYASETGFNSVSEDSIIEYGIMYGVTAWMPLPEPYKEGKHE